MPELYLSVTQLRAKDVVSIHDGCKLGYLHDVNFEASEGRAVSFVVLGPRRFFGLFGRADDYVIPWSDIKTIGDDVILIDSKHIAYTKNGLRLRKRDG
ncbi:MAG: YlmC/YmxH family sporulation protein [Clostridia bacterium]|jgi:YlmC/YmxH family sporulation protein|nr:YlmC/YmxH family sporulation protein [Clostridia bacterium]MBQ1435294.1 YlmC/YmxH family sporulation protein [Clostridia bacterium]MBQ4248885.1 YlmC/YmxH family sporulation protein [Clostridia bacterium]